MSWFEEMLSKVKNPFNVDRKEMYKYTGTTSEEDRMFVHSLFPINELQNHLNKIKMETTILNRLKKLKENNPDLKEILEDKFPELIEKTPFIFAGQVFMKKQYPANLYTLIYANNRFTVINIKDNKKWSGYIPATNSDKVELHNDAPFLNEWDFNLLLKESSLSIKSIRRIPRTDLEELHNKLFNEDI